MGEREKLETIGWKYSAQTRNPYLSQAKKSSKSQAYHRIQARRVDSVEGDSFIFWEVLFSAGGTSL